MAEVARVGLRPEWACLTHRAPREGYSWRGADDGYRTCSSCYDRLHRWLSPIAVDDDGRPDSIPGLYALLNPRPGAAGFHGRRSPGFRPRSPANDHIVAIRDKRSKSCEVARDGVEYIWDPDADNGYPSLPPGVYGPERPPGAYVEKRDVWFGSDGKSYREDTRPVRSVPHVLDSWSQLIAEEREIFPGSGGVLELSSWLDRHLDWTTKQDLVVDFVDDLRVVHSQLRAVGQRRRRIGLCPVTIDEGDTTRECRAVLFAPLHGDEINCWACGEWWPRDKWLRLGDLLDAG